jgi:type IV fimbrial biogenesis protein FimT
MKMSRGFTLIELMIGLALLGLLLMLGLPSFSIMLANQKLRAQAESVANGLQTARAEAVKRNAVVEFLTSDDDTGISGQVATLVYAIPNGGGGLNWAVRAQTAPGVYDYVEGKRAGSNVAMTSTVSSIVFNGLGQASIPATVAYQVSSPQSGLCVSANGPMRCLNVTVSPGGQVRICDPSVTAAGDTRKC